MTSGIPEPGATGAAEGPPLPRFTGDDFGLGPHAAECDLVLKGGVTSGVVYPYALLELARRYRFRSIGGTSAGAIAAAFAAAAEYARTARGDPEGFVRMQRLCDALPGMLGDLFQPSPPFAPLMRYLLKAQAGGPAGWVWRALATFWGTTLTGLVAGAGLLTLLGGGWAGSLLGGVVGLTAALALRIGRLLLTQLPAHGYGMCPGPTQAGGRGPGLTDWLHAALQEIAFGDPRHPTPLTFGHLAGPDPDAPQIDLRMVTTNLSMRRPHTLPRLGITFGYDPAEWSALFPRAVMAHLQATGGPLRKAPPYLTLSRPADLPVLVAVRMSLSFPLLFRAVPMYVRDRETWLIERATGARTPVPVRKVWFTDGGVSSNFPIHLFDALLPTRPTFALSLDDLPARAVKTGERVFIPTTAAEGSGLRAHAIEGLGQFAHAILGSAKDWQDQLLASMPGQRERIARVYLDPAAEGGLNLTMPPEVSAKLMGYGRTVGERFAGGGFDFEEHRWRRALVAYEQLERSLGGARHSWTQGGFGAALAAYMPQARSYHRVGKGDRRDIHRRLAAFAALAEAFEPPIRRKDAKFPRPQGRLRIGPDV